VAGFNKVTLSTWTSISPVGSERFAFEGRKRTVPSIRTVDSTGISESVEEEAGLSA
jgi:hypothetical protein